ncbi:MAG: hypothetical protein KC635_22830, partial [Myxococcales bacterium]|nr:hypothetical protein [Myxococcales bacterium]
TPTTGPTPATGAPAGATPTPAAPPIGRGTEEADVKRFCAPDAIAMQKLADVDAEQYMADVPAATAKQGFYQAVGEYINANHATLAPSAIYNACFNNKAAPYKFKGQKIPAASVSGLSARTAGVGGFWQRQVEQSIFLNEAAAELGLPVGDETVKQAARAKFIGKAKGGGDLMPYLNGGMVAPDGYPAWFTPDKVRIDANTDTAFGDLMKIFALQPEWFAEGNVFFEVDPAAMGELRKPTAYDGMQSSLWVARNQPAETYGMTGGGAREYLAQGVPVSSIKSCRGVVPSEDFLGQVTRLQARAVDKFLEANPHLKAEMDALQRQIDALPDTDPAKKTAKDKLNEIKNWVPNLTDWVLRGQTTQLTSHIGVKIRDAKAALDGVRQTTETERTTPSPHRSAATLVNPAPPSGGGAGAPPAAPPASPPPAPPGP